MQTMGPDMIKHIDESAIWYVSGPKPLIRPAHLAEPGPDEVLVEALVSGVSRGTESLVFQGKIPESEYLSMRAPNQEGDFPHPVKYGYSMVGKIVAGPPDLIEKHVFCLYPHQTRFILHRDKVTGIPDGVPDNRAVLAANMETALNALWDGGAAPGDRVAVVGAGVIGCLTAYLAGRLPGTEVCLIDIDPGRRRIAEALGVGFAAPADATGDRDLVFHASAAQAGLQTAIRLAGFEARIVEMSWYGSKPVAVELGGGFHSRRLRILASQVGAIPADRRARWSFGRRLCAALSLLKDDRLDCLLDEMCDFADAPDCLARWLAPGGHGLCHAIKYS